PIQGGVNTDECIDDIEKYGFHLTDAHIRITERVVRSCEGPSVVMDDTAERIKADKPAAAK
ncbi:MAG: hypothetical protein WBW81_16250, partial [Methylocella sp.]